MSINIHKLISEALDGMWNAQNYGGTSDPPRKDFGPQSPRQGYNFPYNKNAQPPTQPQEPPVEMPANLAWPLQNVPEDLAGIFVRLLDVGNKLSNCLQNNTGISKDQRPMVVKSVKFVVKLLKGIHDLNSFVHNNLEIGSDFDLKN